VRNFFYRAAWLPVVILATVFMFPVMIAGMLVFYIVGIPLGFDRSCDVSIRIIDPYFDMVGNLIDKLG